MRPSARQGRIDARRVLLACWLVRGGGKFRTRTTVVAEPPAHLGSDDRRGRDSARFVDLGRVRYFKHRPRVAHYKPCFAAKVRGEKAVEWMIRLRPHMGTRRQSQIDKAVSSYQVVPSYSHEHPTFSRKRMLELRAEGLTYRAIAARMGCHHSLIGKILNRSMPG